MWFLGQFKHVFQWNRNIQSANQSQDRTGSKKEVGAHARYKKNDQ